MPSGDRDTPDRRDPRHNDPGRHDPARHDPARHDPAPSGTEPYGARPSAPVHPAPRTGSGRGVRPGGEPPVGWKAQHTLWLLLPVVNLAWIGFLVTGRLAHKRAWYAWAALYGLVSAGSFVSLADNAGGGPGGGLGGDVLAGLALLATWAGGTVHGIVVNGEYLRRTWAAQHGALGPARQPPAALPSAPDSASAAQPEPGGLTAREARTLDLARGPRFPRRSADTVRAIDEILQPVLAEQRAGRLSATETDRLTKVVEQYLPQAVEGFLRFPDTFLDLAGRRAHYTEVLDQQLGALHDAATTLQTSVFSDEADEFEANGRYLRDTFGRSSLDLGP